MASDYFVALEFDTSSVPVEDAFRTYASGIPNFAVERRGESGIFHARASMWRIGRMVFSWLEADPATYARSEAAVAQGAAGHLYVNYHEAGAVRLHDDRGGVQQGGAGSLIAIDMRRPCRLEVGKVRQFSLALPREAVLPRLGGLDPHSVVLSGGLIPLLGAQLAALRRTLHRLSARHAATIERQVCELVVDVLREGLARRQSSIGQGPPLAGQARAYLDERLGEKISVAQVAKDLGVSRAKLYRALGNGGLLREAQALRLRRLRGLLEDPAETRSIAMLSRQLGFSDPSHCVRAFRQAFGITPHAYRSTPREAPIQPLAKAESPQSAVFRSWVTSVD